MDRILTLDLGWGDSGKGKVVNWLTKNKSADIDPYKALVVRYSGGSQCGHNVYNNGIHHEFSTLGSGSFNGAKTYIGREVYFNPVKLLNEIDIFYEKSKVMPEIHINKQSKIVINMDIKSNERNNETLSHGSCGQGLYEAVKREKAGYHLKALDLLYPDILTDKLHLIHEHYYKDITKDKWIVDEKLYRHICEEIKKYDIRFVTSIDDIPRNLEVWECNQGLLLDENIGFMPHCTPTNIIPYDFVFSKCFLITRSYHTRHGDGTFNKELKDYTNPHEHNFTNVFQKNFRTAYLDVNKLQYALEHVPAYLAYKFNLVINHLDIEDKIYWDKGMHVCRTREAFVSHIVKKCSEVINLDKVYISDDLENITLFK